jgi:hypothetical protein
MTPKSFSEYAAQPNLSEDEIYTIEILIEYVRSEFDPGYWSGSWMERSDARRAPGYLPSFEAVHIPKAEKLFAARDWLSFQQIGNGRPIRDLRALRFFPALSGLILKGSEVCDLEPLRDCRNLRRLDLTGIPATDASAIAECTMLEELNIRDAAIEDLAVLERLPRLKELEISSDQVSKLKKLRALLGIEKIDIGGEAFDSFTGFPAMPELRIIRNATVNNLDGLECFPALVNLVGFGGEFDDLRPLQTVAKLTHINILGSRVRSLAPISKLFSLRCFRFQTEVRQIDLSPLEGLPALHEVYIKCADEEPGVLDKIRDRLTSWDLEFRAEKPRYTPSLQLEIVDQEIFDFYDTKSGYGLTATDTNYGLLSSELEWLDEHLEEVFSVDFEEDEDYSLPFRWGGARSRTVVVLSDRAVEDFRSLVLGMQRVLCNAKNDWILYFQSEETEAEFIIWVYPDRIVTTAEYAEQVRGLIQH